MTNLSMPLELPCGAMLPNRLAKGAMTEGLATANGTPTPELERLYRIWAEGGAGMLLTGNVQIDRDHLERPGNVVIDGPPSAELRTALERWAKAGTAGGNHLWMQISHAGRQTPALVNKAPKAPSAVKVGLPGGQFGMPIALTPTEIHTLIDRFVATAVIARETGFTGVQFHAAHGYLLSAFLSPRANIRTDEWGGALESRARMLIEIVKRARVALSADYPISVKLNSADFQKGGFAFEESVIVAGWLQNNGVDLIEISGGSYEQPKMMDMAGLEPGEEPAVTASTAAREAYFVDFAKTIKASVSVPMMVTGGFRTRAAMAHALESGGADLIGIGRPMCADPDGPKQLLNGAAGLRRWERELHLLPAPLRWLNSIGMVRAIGSFAITYWYYAQLYALGRTGSASKDKSVFASWREVEATHKALMGERKSIQP
ncbi:MAG: NADH:flavin oxidoreductase/NADH oxidase family protein [Pseudomonadota bacterium]